MSDASSKPLRWKPGPDVGYTVTRRPDGGMHYVFTDISRATLEHWRNFAVEHLLDSSRLTRNLFDLRAITEISDEAVQYAVELNSDPSARNIRVAVVVATPEVESAVREVAALTAPGGVEMAVFDEMQSAEEWLNRPLTENV